MPLEEHDKAYLWDMLDAALAIQEFIRDKGPQDYLTNRMLRGAVERHIEIIGEAARRVSEELKREHPEVPWRSMIGQRNVLAHEYGEVRHEKIWIVAKEFIPLLVNSLRSIMRNEEGGE